MPADGELCEPGELPAVEHLNNLLVSQAVGGRAAAGERGGCKVPRAAEQAVDTQADLYGFLIPFERVVGLQVAGEGVKGIAEVLLCDEREALFAADLRVVAFVD